MIITFRVPKVWKNLINQEAERAETPRTSSENRTDLFDPHLYYDDSRVVEGYDESGEREATLTLCSGQSNYYCRVVVQGVVNSLRQMIYEDDWETIDDEVICETMAGSVLIKVVWLDEPDIYEVILTRDATESCRVKVKAVSHDEAEEKALVMAGRYGQNVKPWAPDEGNDHEVYVSYIELTAQGDGTKI